MPEFRPATEEPPPTAPESEPSATPERPKRRRGRTTLLVLAAAVLGVSGGAAYGYTVQADRQPTPLAALSQSDLAYPARASTTAKSAAERHKTDGDLRKLLLPRPAGARDAKIPTFEGGLLPDDHWMSVREYIEEFEKPSAMLSFVNGAGVRRIAASDWTQGAYRAIAIRLVQFGKDEGAGAIDHVEDRMFYLNSEATREGTLKGSADGAWVLFPVERQAGYMPVYHAQAVAFRGDVMVEVHIFDTKQIKAADIRSLGERQVGRL